MPRNDDKFVWDCVCFEFRGDRKWKGAEIADAKPDVFLAFSGGFFGVVGFFFEGFFFAVFVGTSAVFPTGVELRREEFRLLRPLKREKRNGRSALIKVIY